MLTERRELVILIKLTIWEITEPSLLNLRVWYFPSGSQPSSGCCYLCGCETLYDSRTDNVIRLQCASILWPLYNLLIVIAYFGFFKFSLYNSCFYTNKISNFLSAFTVACVLGGAVCLTPHAISLCPNTVPHVPPPLLTEKKGGRLRGSLFYPCLLDSFLQKGKRDRELAVQRKWGFLSGEM